ncbi:MAG: hypothetical protein MUE78_06430, partial [Ilumatobacteraceae bacterium]|nr:hypothetical protein [Ilumatobacteraceae bacterium]
YAEYSAGVRAEYGHLDDDTWRIGRSAVLRSLLARPALFVTAGGIERFEHTARANLTAELAALSAGG